MLKESEKVDHFDLPIKEKKVYRKMINRATGSRFYMLQLSMAAKLNLHCFPNHSLLSANYSHLQIIKLTRYDIRDQNLQALETNAVPIT